MIMAAATLFASIVNAAIAKRDADTNSETARREQVAAEQATARQNKENAERHSAQVSLLYQPSHEYLVTTDTRFRIENPSFTEIEHFRIIIEYEGKASNGTYQSGTAVLSSSENVPPCSAIDIAPPLDLNLASRSLGLSELRLTAVTPRLYFFQDSAPWLLDSASTLFGDGESVFLSAEIRDAKDLGELQKLHLTRLTNCQQLR